MSETHPSHPSKEEEVKVGRLDYNALADAFEAQGNSVEAKRYRNLAQQQPELQKQSRKELTSYLDNMQQEEKRNQPNLRPLEPHERSDTVQISPEEFMKDIRAKVEKMLPVKSPPPPNTARKTPPSSPGQGTAGK